MDRVQVDEEAPIDPGAHQAHHSFSEQDFEGHRAHTVYADVHVSGDESSGSGKFNSGSSSQRKGHHHHHHRRHRHHSHSPHRQHQQKSPSNGSGDGSGKDDVQQPLPSTQRVQFILGEDGEPGSSSDAEANSKKGVANLNGSGAHGNGNHKSHPLFSEMEELVQHGNDFEWKETARWVKFEEDVEEGGDRWSKPHVATLSLHALFELRSLLLNNIVMLDMEAQTLDQIVDLLLESMVGRGHLPEVSRNKVREALLRRHRHLHDKANKKKDASSASGMSKFPIVRSLAEIGKKTRSSTKSTSSAPVMESHESGGLDPNGSGGSIGLNQSGTNLVGGGDAHTNKHNSHFMRKIPLGAEASSILVGEVDFLEKSLSAFVRLSEAIVLGDLTEVPVPTRFVFVLLGPMGGITRYHEIGRSMATLMSDEVFHDVAYKAMNIQHLLAGFDEFLDAATVLPPGEWDASIRIEPPAAIPSQDNRKHHDQTDEPVHEVDERTLREAAGLVRTGKLFGGLINDIKRRRAWYWSDFKDAMNLQCVASWIFLYFASLTPVVTFGGLLEAATHQKMAAIESLVAGSICGVVSGIFSGQPLILLGCTGPILVFETILVQACDYYNLDYLQFRVWIGVWMGSFLVILVAVDASAYAAYITRFTEENFATLIAFIFMVEAVKNVISIKDKYPMNPQSENTEGYECKCRPTNSSDETSNVTWMTVNFDDCTKPPYFGELVGGGCAYYPDVFLMSVILFVGTFLISVTLKDFRTSSFFPSTVRRVVGDFAVVIAVISMTCLDMLGGLRTPKLLVPDTFRTTLPSRGWFIHPFGKNPTWSIFGAILPAIFATILIFMDQQITAVIINRKEHNLKKGGGYHLDMLVVALLIVFCSFLGIPWFVAATILSMNHVNSLRMESECSAPGETPQFLGLREQRATHILIFIMIGFSVSITPILKKVPMPVLYGVFLYMGFSSLKNMQLFQRILIMFMPAKYQPDHIFLRQIPLMRVHMYTMIQVSCLIVLWLIKSFKSTSIIFPLLLVVMIVIRKLLDHVFSEKELKILDRMLPDTVKRRSKEDLETSMGVDLKKQ